MKVLPKETLRYDPRKTLNLLIRFFGEMHKLINKLNVLLYLTHSHLKTFLTHTVELQSHSPILRVQTSWTEYIIYFITVNIILFRDH